MKIIDTIADIAEVAAGSVLTIGNFDGLHLGHQQIIRAAQKARHDHNAKVLAAMTFYPHPVAILHPEKSPGLLTPLALKKQLLKDYGIDCLIVLKDSFDLLNLSPRDFIDEFLMHHVNPSVVVEGKDFNFGYGRSGDIETLKQFASQRGFEVVVVDPVQIELATGQTVTVSSTLIRHLLQKCSVADAARALGRPYRLMGRVVKGRGIGKDLGYPTANVHPSQQIVPEEGVYAGFVEIADDLTQLALAQCSLPAVFSIGRAKTFITDHPLLIEAHVLDCNVGDLQDKYLAMDFVDFLRHQQRFESKHDLAQQIAKDCQKAKEILK